MFFRRKQQGLKNLKEAEEAIKYLEQRINVLTSDFKKQEKELENCLQKLELVRFNPFDDLGGDQSFSLAILDKKDNGFVLTSIYTSEGVRVFSKPINKGLCKYQLAKEEERAIEKAKKRNYGE